MRTNEDFDWVRMSQKGTLAKLDVPALNLFLGRYHLAHGKINEKRRKYIQSMHGQQIQNTTRYNRVEFVIKITKLKMTTVILLNRSVDSDVSDDEDDVILLEAHEPIDNDAI